MRDARRLRVGSGIENVSECIRCVIQALASRKLATKSVSLTEAMVNLDVPLVVAVVIRSGSDQLGIAGAHVGGHVVEGNKPGAYRTALIGIINTGVRVPELAFRIAAHSRGIESCAADLAKVTVAHSSTRNPRPESSCGGIP